MKTLTLVLLLTAMIVTGCGVEPAKESIQHGNFTVELLFTQDGCNMYRFYDGNKYVYWANCAGTVQSSYSTGGKHRRTHPQYVQTTISDAN